MNEYNRSFLDFQINKSIYVTCFGCKQPILLGDTEQRHIPGHDFLLYCKNCGDKIFNKYIRKCELCGIEYQAKRIDEKNCLCLNCYSEFNKRELYRLRGQRKRQVSLLSLREWLEILDRYEHRCFYCGCEYNSIDHLIPISKGGYTTKDNCVPCCRNCNSKKGNKSLEEFMDRIKQL